MPVSDTLIVTMSSSCEVEIKISPPDGIASTELLRIFIRTSSSFTGSPVISGASVRS